MDDIGTLLGYKTERPDKHWKSGPDNLWALREGECLFIECKNEVKKTRLFIEKSETGQFNNNHAWYKRSYANAKTHFTMVIPTKKVNSNTGFNEPVRIMRERKLSQLKNNFRSFILGFQTVDFRSVSEDFIQKSLAQHELTTDNIISNYFEDHVQMR